jgi:hypothetical protein
VLVHALASKSSAGTLALSMAHAREMTPRSRRTRARGRAGDDYEIIIAVGVRALPRTLNVDP